MKKNKKWFLKIGLGLALLLCCYGFGISYIIWNVSPEEKRPGETNKHYIALITKSTESAFWKSVFAGANAAGTEYNLTLTFDGPENEEDYQTQNEMVARAVEDGAEAIVFSAVDYNANAEAINAAAAKGVKIVVIDSEVNSDQVSSCISTNNYEAGRMAGKAALAAHVDQLRVGIVNFDKNSANGQQREEGLREVLQTEPGAVIAAAVNTMSTTEDSMEKTKEMLREHPEINVIVTFNEWTSLGVGYAIEELGLAEETHVVAFDSNVVSVAMLENGCVDALIVQNPYAMGYLGVECACGLLGGSAPVSENVETATTLITRENMYEEECQKALFTFD